MLNLRKIAVVGDLASGKSSVCRFFKKKGAYVLNSDDIVHNLLSSNIAVKKQVVELFSSDIITNSQIDRKKLAKKVFSNQEKLELLEKIIHPYVFKEIEDQYKQENKRNENSLFVVEIPLLFETGHQNDYDTIIYVTSDKNTCKKRWNANNKETDEYEKRAKRFMLSSEKIKLSDYIIENNSSLQDLENQVIKLVNKLTKNKPSRR